MSNTYMDGVT